MVYGILSVCYMPVPEGTIFCILHLLRKCFSDLSMLQNHCLREQIAVSSTLHKSFVAILVLTMSICEHFSNVTKTCHLKD